MVPQKAVAYIGKEHSGLYRELISTYYIDGRLLQFSATVKGQIKYIAQASK